jgi:hypothetical protein
LFVELGVGLVCISCRFAVCIAGSLRQSNQSDTFVEISKMDCRTDGEAKKALPAQEILSTALGEQRSRLLSGDYDMQIATLLPAL